MRREFESSLIKSKAEVKYMPIGIFIDTHGGIGTLVANLLPFHQSRFFNLNN